MQPLFDSLSRQLGTDWKPVERKARRGHVYRCRCGRPVFFRNCLCLGCNTALGYDPERGELLALEPGPVEGVWLAAPVAHAVSEPPTLYRRCANYDNAAACNWLLDIRAPDLPDAPQTLCRCCRLNRMIPNQSDETGRVAWSRVEQAKRRLVAQLIGLGLPVASKLGEDPQRGLMFEFLACEPGGPRVLTGHASGLITLNIEEADDAVRERNRAALHEPYRTLLGHLRHEVGHYYWDRLVDGTPWLAPWRALFGDERASYSEALQRNYREGPPPDWPQRYISGYASSHPWEDWAETWAQYLHIADALETALGFGLEASDVDLDAEPFGIDALDTALDPDGVAFLGFVNAWVELSALLNELSRSMGQPDLYPFVLSRTVVRKLHFVHRVVRAPTA
jgi:hypothetical protein